MKADHGTSVDGEAAAHLPKLIAAGFGRENDRA